MAYQLSDKNEGLHIRMADAGDLVALEALYARVVASMRAEGVDIWDEAYPWGAIPGDVAAGELLVACAGDAVLGACRVSDWIENVDEAGWSTATGLCMGRLAVDPAARGRGVASALMTRCLGIACERGREALRLFVVDVNAPAIAFYEAYGFSRLPGEFQLDLDGRVLNEYPYELVAGSQVL